MSVNIKIAKASLILIAASVFGHILSMGKEIIVANYFGISKSLDAFYVALTIPNMVFSTILSPFTIIFIPIFIKNKLQDKEEANRIASILVNYIFIILLVFALFVSIFSKYIIRYGFSGLDAETSALSIKILRILAVSIVFSGLVRVLESILNAYEHFLWPAITQMFITISIILSIVLLLKQWGVYVFVWGTLIGLILQFAFLVPISGQKGYTHYFDYNWNHPEIRKILKLMLIFLALTAIGGLNPVINRIMASWLPSGSIAALAYADKLIQVPIIIFAGSITTAIYPFLSTQFAENKMEEMKNTLATSIKMGGFIFIPMAITMIVLAEPIVKLLFQRGAFDNTATKLTSKIFIYYALQLFSIYALAFMTRLILIFHDMLNYLKITIVSILLNILLNFVFMRIINPPAAGIALSTSTGFFISTLFCFYILKKKITYLHGLSIFKSLLKITLVGIISGIVTFFVFHKLNTFFNTSIVYQVIKLGGSATAGAASFILITFLLKIEETAKIYNLIRKHRFSFGELFS